MGSWVGLFDHHGGELVFLRRCLFLLALAALLGGCQRLVTPLDRQLSAVTPESGSEAQIVQLAACWEAEPLAMILRDGYEESDPDSAVFVTLTHSAQVVARLEGGEATLGVISTPRGATPELPEGWVVRELAVDGIALVASADLSLASLSRSDLARLYSGQVLDWSELGVGAGQPMVVTREQGAVLRQVFETQVMDGAPISSAAVVQPHTEAALRFVAENSGALGYVPVAQLNGGVPVVALRNVLPTAAQVESGAYPLAYSLWLVLPVSGGGSTDGGALRLATYALSARGVDAIESAYVTP